MSAPLPSAPMAYAIENAIFQWEEGEARLRDVGPAERRALERAIEAVQAELRRRLGSSFTLAELSDLYSDADWAAHAARGAGRGTDAAWVADAAFCRYAREAADYGGSWRR